VVVSADHHLPDRVAFAEAITVAAESAASGKIVTLGVRPTSPATAYGYMRAAGDGRVKEVAAFVEKPDAARAEQYVSEGYLWNSGNFVVAVKTLLAELEAFAPQVLEAARRAVGPSSDRELRLSAGFLDAPKISIDYAVMEKTAHAAVLPVDFSWSDIGAWDAVWDQSAKDGQGNVADASAVLDGSSNCLVRAPRGMQVAVLGLQNVAVVVADNNLLVCNLEHSQAVKKAAEQIAARPEPGFADLAEAAEWYRSWLFTKALPVWWCLGADPAGGFHEALDHAANPIQAPRRARVQCRQAFTYALGGQMGWRGPWETAAKHGWDFFRRNFLRGDGLYRTLVDEHGATLNEEAFLYDQAFALLALAALQKSAPEGDLYRSQALDLLASLQGLRHGNGGLREAGAHPFQANAQMHLLEACMAWLGNGERAFQSLAEEIVDLALARFIDPQGGFLREFFDEGWRPVAGDDGRLLEPGHQFEWCWLLTRWGRAMGNAAASSQAKRLFQAGCRGVDELRSVAINALWDDLSPRDPQARLWPQTEYLKASLALGETGHALRAASGLRTYLGAPVAGLWWDRLSPTGRFEPEPAPASSFYHIALACQELFNAAEKAV
jgi:mannose/cellobiose epimerase-like protein (N-acyl-D-glucosamine 2-epimerase family)